MPSWDGTFTLMLLSWNVCQHFPDEIWGFVVNTLDDVCQVLDVIRPDVRKCSVCGCEFPLGAKTKRDMCDSCYRKYRRGYKTAKDYTYYHKKSSKSSIPDRNTAVTINGRGMNKN